MFEPKILRLVMILTHSLPHFEALLHCFALCPGAGPDLPGGAAAPGKSPPVGRGDGEGGAHHHDPDRERVRELRLWRPPQGQGALEVRTRKRRKE